MPRLLVVFHTPSPGTEALAAAVVRGAGAEGIDGVDVRRVAPLDAGPDDVREADAVILGTTENFGYMSGALKDFFDRTYYQVLDETRGRPYALVVKGRFDDGSGTVTAVGRIVTGLAWREVRPPLVVIGDVGEDDLAAAEELGATVAALLTL